MSFFSFFSKPKPKALEKANLGTLKTDIHSHIIWGIDDGAKLEEDSLSLIYELKNLGYTKAITSPHIMDGVYDNDSTIISRGLEKVNELIYKNNIEFKLEAAAEYYIDDSFLAKIAKRDILTFGDDFVLIEFPMIDIPVNSDVFIFELQAKGYKVVIAHPERYKFTIGKTELYDKWKSLGCYLQVNLLGAVERYDEQTTAQVKYMADNKLIDFLGSDAHNTRQLSVVGSNTSSALLHTILDTCDLKNNLL